MEQVTLGELKVEGLPYYRIEKLRIKTKAGIHGICDLQLMLQKIADSSFLQKLEGQKIKILHKTEIVFMGIITQVEWLEQSDYNCLHVHAVTISREMDIQRHSRTFQLESKTLSDVANAIAKPYGVQVAVQDNPVLPRMLYQHEETDWQFLVRLAESTGHLLFTNCASNRIALSLGFVPFSERKLATYDKIDNISLPVSTCLKVKENIRPHTMSCEFQDIGIITFDLQLTAGHGLEYEYRTQAVLESQLTSTDDLLVNHITLRHKEGCRPTAEEELRRTNMPQQLTGTILAVEGTNAKVKFDCDEQQNIDEACWIPYENTVNNYQYSMPDVGDHVFVYFEENGEKVALGSHRGELGGNPDYDMPENRNLTSTNNMVQFQPNSVVMIAGRSGVDSASITADDSHGIRVISNHDVVVKSNQDIVIQSGTNSVEDTSGKLVPGFGRGYDKYIGEGGQPLEQTLQFDANPAQIGKDAGVMKGLGTPYEAPITSDLGKSMFHQSGGKGKHPLSYDPMVDFATGTADGRVSIQAGHEMTLQVRGSQLCISKDSDTVSLRSALVAGEGYIHNQYAQMKTTLDMSVEANKQDISAAIDVVLGIACLIPPFSLGATVLLVSKKATEALIAGKQGEAVEEVVLAMIPFGVGKLARTALGAKTLGKVAAGIEAVKGNTLSKIRDMAVALSHFASKDVLSKNIKTLIDKGTKAMPWLKGKMENVAEKTRNIAMGRGRKSGGNSKGMAEVNGEQKLRPESTPAVNGTKQNVGERTEVCDPVDVATGSFHTTITDYRQKDFFEDFLLTRTYESIYENPGQHLGSRWLINVGSCLERRDKQLRILGTDMHLEKFTLQDDGNWQNDRGGDQGISLTENEAGYQLVNQRQKKTYLYNESGQLTDIILRQSAKIHIEHQGRQISTVRLADGQELQFLYEENKIAQITDCIGRTIRYEYDDDFLTCVTYPNGGRAEYTYTPEGWISTLTDQNGICYLRNSYDREGRVLHQQMKNGAEYILFYDDQNRRTTVTDQHSGKRVTYHWNRQRLVEKTVYQDGTTAEKAYDERENVIYEKDRLGRETHRAYNTASQLVREELPTGLIRQFHYDEQGNLQEKTDNTGACIRYQYDSHGWLTVRETKCGENKWKKETWTYDWLGRVLTVDINGQKTSYRYEGELPIPVSMITPEGACFYYEYDNVCRLMTIRSELGERNFGYNVMDYRTVDIDALGNQESWQYDLMGNLRKQTSPKGQVSRYYYDSMDNCIREEAPEEIVYIRDYDGESRLTKEIHPEAENGEGIAYDYDTDGHKIRTQYPDGGVERCFYDAEGNLIKKVTPNHYNASTDDGAGTTYTYDAGNRRTSVTSDTGVLLEVSRYDAKGRCIYHQDSGQLEASREGMVYATTYRYDLAGNKLEERKAVSEKDGAIQYSLRRWTYDIHNNITEEKTWLTLQSETSASGLTRTICNTYDKQNRLIRVTDNLGAEVKYTYNSIGKRTSEERKVNAEETQLIKYLYDEIGRLIDRAEKLNQKRKGTWWAHTRYAYDANSNIIEIQFPNGSKIQRDYDAVDRLIAETVIDHASGQKNTTNFAYDKAGNIIHITDDCGCNKEFTYNLMNQRTQEITSEGRKQNLFYDKEGNITERQLTQEMSYRYRYDSAGRLTAVIGTDGKILETVAYDRAGRRVKVETAGGSGAEYAYTAAGWQTRIETKGGASQAYNYDAQGNVTGIIDGNGNETKYILDSWGRITEIRKADGSKENYVYDFAGNICEAVDGNGNIRKYAYDDNNQLKSITYPDGSQEQYLYGVDGNLSKYQDRNGITNEYTWNVYGSMTERKAGDLRNVYEYAANGRLTAAISNGMDYRYTYDKDGLLTAKKASGRTLLAYTYDELGRKTSQTDITGRKVNYKFDQSNNLVDVCNEIDQSIVSFERDADGAIEKITHANGMCQDIAYDADKNITSLTVATPDKLLAQNTYRYDGNGQRIEKNELTGKTLYTYDSLNRLAQAEYPSYTERFTYDHAGNRLTRTAKDIEEQYVYDVNNRLTRRTVNGQEENYRYDNAGNLLQDANNTYEYDAFRRTSNVTTKAGMNQINRYDAEGLRYEMEENGKLVQFIFNENKEVIAEKEDGNITRLIRTSDLWAMESEPEKTWYHYASDEQGSTIFITDKTGSVKNRYAYDAFGNIVAKEEQIANRFQYTGQQFDQITQQYYLRARFYNPAIARFTQEDEYHGDGLNLYVYCANNPIEYYDQSGYDKSKTGMGYKGNATHFHSVGQNIMPTMSKYKYQSGYFGENSVHGGNSTRNISSKDNLNTATDFYNKIANGGKERIVNDNMRITEMHDGTIITMRKVSHSDKTPVVDINVKNSARTGGVKKQKIHFVREDK